MAAEFRFTPDQVDALTDAQLIEWGGRAIYLRQKRFEALEVVIANGVAKAMRKRRR